jgi:TRAP-type mannitol/chloroaromatic compound transport system permease small subunit
LPSSHLPYMGRWEEGAVYDIMNHILSLLRGIDAISAWSGKILRFLILVIGGMLCYEAILRYAFNAPTIWAHELSLHVFGAYSVLGGGYVLLLNEHVRADIIYARLSSKGKTILDLICFPIFLMLAAVIFVEGAQLAAHSLAARETTLTFLRSPIYPVKVCIPVAAFLLLLQGLAYYIRSLARLTKGKRPN